MDNSLVRDHPADTRSMSNNLSCKPCSMVEEEEEEGEKEKRRKKKASLATLHTEWCFPCRDGHAEGRCLKLFFLWSLATEAVTPLLNDIEKRLS